MGEMLMMSNVINSLMPLLTTLTILCNYKISEGNVRYYIVEYVVSLYEVGYNVHN